MTKKHHSIKVTNATHERLKILMKNSGRTMSEEIARAVLFYDIYVDKYATAKIKEYYYEYEL